MLQPFVAEHELQAEDVIEPHVLQPFLSAREKFDSIFATCKNKDSASIFAAIANQKSLYQAEDRTLELEVVWMKATANDDIVNE